jgi:hypothetical protein
MKFLALLKRQRGEILGTGVIPVVSILGLGYLLVSEAIQHQYQYREFYDASYSPLSVVGPLLIFAAILCGTLMGFLQFWMPGFRRTWHFILHRSVTKKEILLAMITAAVLTFVIFAGGSWTLLFLYASLPGIFVLPPAFQVYIEGWLFIALGVVFYFGVAISGISTARWYTTKLFPIAFAGVILIITFMGLEIIWAAIVVAAGVLILAIQASFVFLDGEF